MFSCVAIIVNDVVVSIHTKSKCNKQFFSSINDGLVNRGILLFIYHQEINANIILILFHVDKYTTIQTTVIETCYLRNKTSVHVFNGRIKYKYEFRYDLITCIGMSTYIYRCTETRVQMFYIYQKNVEIGRNNILSNSYLIEHNHLYII